MAGNLPSTADVINALEIELLGPDPSEGPSEGLSAGGRSGVSCLEAPTNPENSEGRLPTCSIPASADPHRSSDGRFLPGNPATGAGRPKGVSLVVAMRRAWEEAPTEVSTRLAAFAVGCDPSEVPPFETLQEMTAWVFTLRAGAGSVEHFKEIGDRTDPKPKRLELGVYPSTPPAAASSNGDEAAAARAYYESTGGGA